MVPALARTTSQCKLAECEANMKFLSQALQLYARDNGDLLPNVPASYTAWDLPFTTRNALMQYGVQRAQFYDPGFPQQNIDICWNGAPLGPYSITGYVFALSARTIASDDYNSSIDVQVLSLTGNDPQLTATVPAVNGQIKINPSRRVLVTDALLSNSGQTDPVQWTSYNWALDRDSGYPGNPNWSSPAYGPWQGSGSPHLNSKLLPTGANEGMLDGHVEWVPWISRGSEMVVHTTFGISDPFWWQSDPAKL
jgi:hypothetical protein